MKFIFAILFIAAAFFAGWHFYPDIHKDMTATIDKREKSLMSAEDRIRNKVLVEERKTASTKAEALMDQAKKAAASINGGEKPIANPALTAGGGGKPVTPAVAVTAGPADEIEAKYPMPTFKTVEEITKDWTSIPSRAFPRPVTTKVPVTFEVGNGSMVLPEGTKVRAVAMIGGLLVLMRDGDENNRVQVPLANTDLKEFLTTKYEEWKNYRRDMVIKQRERARGLKEKANGATEAQMTAAGPKPEVRPGGVIPVMLEDLQNRKLSELKANAITAWGDLNFEDVDGKTFWTGTVQCTVENALFGPQPTEVMALIKDNKVVKWMYTGSREEVQ
jgi:hypothetical protein